jgi:hypothetical protein
LTEFLRECIFATNPKNQKTMFTGNEDHTITLQEASDLTARFRLSVGALGLKGGYFSKSAIQAVLNQPDAVGIRFYYGISLTFSPVLVMVGVKANGDDLINGIVLDKALMCPPACSVSNSLNS